MRIVYYETDYFESCTDLLMKAYNNEFCQCHFTQAKGQQYLEELIQAPRFVGFLLLDDDEKLVGAALCHERTWWYKDELHINEFLIDPNHQKLGYGSHLLKYMHKYATKRDLAGVTLITNNMVMAEFYEKNKFHEHEICFMYRGVDGLLA